MYRSILFITLLIFNSEKGCNDPTSSDLIVWSKDNILNFEDFQSKKDLQLSDRAYSVIQLRSNYRINSDGKLKKFEVLAVFVKSKSWFGQPSDNVLQHEQLHFDIGELHARMMRQSLIKIKDEKKTVDPKILSDMLNKFGNDMTMMQNEYDSEIAHSFGSEKQEEWSSKIRGLLEKYSKFK